MKKQQLQSNNDIKETPTDGDTRSISSVHQIGSDVIHPAGYKLRTMFHVEGASKFKVTSAYTIKDEYIGNEEDAKRLIVQRGIKPELARLDSNVCSIGFCEKDQKWYGWSHRAIYGFGIGYVAKKGSLPTESGYINSYIEEHPEKDRRVPVGFEVKTLEDARRVAVAFADSVS